MPREDREEGEVDGKRALIRQEGAGVDALYNFDPSLHRGHDHLISRDGESAVFVRDQGQVVWDERKFIIAEKERIITEAEGLSADRGFHTGHQRAQELRQRFKKAGFAGEKTEPKLRARFEAALKRFYDQSKQDKEKRQKQQDDAARRKQALVGQALRLAESSDWKSASTRLRELMEEWKRAGSAGHDRDERLWHDVNAARGRFRERREAHFSRLEKEFDRNRERKRRIVGEAATIAASGDLRTAFAAMRGLMEQWKATGSAGWEHDQQLWKSFQQSRDRLHQRGDAERERAVLAKRALLSEASSVAAYTDLRQAGQQWKSIMERWKSAGHGDRVNEDDLWGRLQGYRHQLDARYEQSKVEWQQRSRDRIQRLEAAAARKRQAISELDGRIAEVYSRPPVRPGPRQWEIESRRSEKIARLSSFRDSHQQALMEIESKLRDAYSRSR